MNQYDSYKAKINNRLGPESFWEKILIPALYEKKIFDKLINYLSAALSLKNKKA